MPVPIKDLVKGRCYDYEYYPVYNKDKVAQFMRNAHTYAAHANPPRKVSTELFKAVSCTTDEVINMVKIMVIDEPGEAKPDGRKKPRVKKAKTVEDLKVKVVPGERQKQVRQW